MNKILIIGKGELGRALEFVLGKNRENKIVLAGRNFEGNLPEAEIVFLAVPTASVEEIVKRISDDKLIVLLSKGLTDSGETALETAKKNFTGRIALISGPMIAEELSAGKNGYGLVGGETKKVIDCFKETGLFLEESDDLTGLSWCGVLKNIYSIGLGLKEKETGSNNDKGVFVAKANVEMSKLIKFFEGREETVHTVAGLGDLIATGFSPDSSNFRAGLLLAEGKNPGISEGLSAAGVIGERISNKVDAPILYGIITRITHTQRSS